MPDQMNAGEELTRRLVRAFEAAAERLAERGAGDAEIGRAMVAAGLSRWSREAPGEALVEQLAGLTAGYAAACGIDLGKEAEPEWRDLH